MVARTAKQPVEQIDLSDALTPEDVAKILRVKTDTLAMWRRKLIPNKPPFVPISPKVVFYPRAQFNAWLNRQKLVDPSNLQVK